MQLMPTKKKKDGRRWMRRRLVTPRRGGPVVMPSAHADRLVNRGFARPSRGKRASRAIVDEVRSLRLQQVAPSSPTKLELLMPPPPQNVASVTVAATAHGTRVLAGPRDQIHRTCRSWGDAT
eukprot:8804710-Pyramimonas_sp.AAC.1